MNKLKSFLPDALVIIFFIAISLLYFFRPVTEGLVIQGHDHTGGVGAGVEMQEYYQRTGERTRWTNVLFSGMPTYQMSPSYDSTDTLVGLQRIYQLGLPTFAMYVFILLAGFYILLRAFGFRAGMAAAGAVMWAFSSYFFIITGAGHIWKLMALAYIPPTVAGMVLCYRGRYLWGGLVTAFFLALQILSNHIQMSYYFLMVMGLMALAYLITAIREGKTARWLAATGVLAVAALIGLGINLSNQTLLDGDYKTGLTAGVFADYRFSNLFALSADVLYSRQGTKGEGVKVKTDNLNIPILANFYLVKGLAVKAGIQPGFLLKAKNNDVDVKAAYKKADVAVPVGVSYLFNCGLILDARYNIGLTSLAKDKDIVTRNSVFAITAGWRF